jgi:hypothetical protein
MIWPGLPADCRKSDALTSTLTKSFIRHLIPFNSKGGRNHQTLKTSTWSGNHKIISEEMMSK